PSRRWLLGLFVLALVPRLALLATRTDRLEFWEYEILARNIVAGHGYVIPHFGRITFAFGDGALYSFLAARVYFIAGPQAMVLATGQAVFASLAAPTIFALGSRAFGPTIAGVGAALAALHPGLLAYTLKLHPLGFDVLLMALMVLWTARAAESHVHPLGAGLALGMALMSRPTFFVSGIAALAVRVRQTRQLLLPTVAALGVAGALAAPWVVRNWAVLGQPVFISTSLEDVWKGNNANASGSGYLPSGQDVFAAAPPELQARFRQGNELALNELFG